MVEESKRVRLWVKLEEKSLAEYELVMLCIHVCFAPNASGHVMSRWCTAPYHVRWDSHDSFSLL
jgi:hypothetical protein